VLRQRSNDVERLIPTSRSREAEGGVSESQALAPSLRFAPPELAKGPPARERARRIVRAWGRWKAPRGLCVSLNDTGVASIPQLAAALRQRKIMT